MKKHEKVALLMRTLDATTPYWRVLLDRDTIRIAIAPGRIDMSDYLSPAYEAATQLFDPHTRELTGHYYELRIKYTCENTIMRKMYYRFRGRKYRLRTLIGFLEKST